MQRSVNHPRALLASILLLVVSGCGGGGGGAADAPTITTQPQPVSVTEGQTATFSVVATGTAPLSYQWRRNGVPIGGATAASYTTPATLLTDNGASFSVFVSNAAGDATSGGAVLTVNAASPGPSITQQPQAATVPEGQTATFTVVASGTGTLTYQWQRNGVPIGGAILASYTTPATVPGDNAAVFRVVVTDNTGSTTSNNAVLTVTAATSDTWIISEAGTPAAGQNIVWGHGTSGTFTPAIVAINTAAPAPAVQLEAAGGWQGAGGSLANGNFVEADFDVGGAITAMRTRYSVYPKNNRLMRIDHQPGAAAPVPALLSSTPTSDICLFWQRAHDFANPGLSRLIFNSPGLDGNCLTADDVSKAIRLDMSPTDAAVTIPIPLAVVYDTDGAIGGYIVRTGGFLNGAGQMVQRVSAAFASPVNLFSTGFGITPHLVFGASAPGIWVYTEAVSGGSRLMAYRLDGSGGPEILLDLPNGGPAVGAFAPEGSNLYFASVDNGVVTIRRVQSNLVVTTLGTFTIGTGAGTGVNELAVTDSHVVARANGRDLWSVPKAGAAGQLIAQLPTNSAAIGIERVPLWNSFNFTEPVSRYLLAAGGNVWFQTLPAGSGTPGNRVWAVSGDGAGGPQIFEGARIASWSAAATLSSIDQAWKADTLYLAEGSANGTFASAPVRAYDGSTRAIRFTVGTLPNSILLGIHFNQPARPLQYGLPGLITTSSVADNLHFFRGGQPGLTQATSY